MTFKNITHLNSSKVQITASVIFEGGGPKFKGLLRRQDMIFVDIIIITSKMDKLTVTAASK